ncbi:glycosyltransferase family 39 protein [bacterium]|nr:glycosyltransferase family 39 protein [bacterium]
MSPDTPEKQPADKPFSIVEPEATPRPRKAEPPKPAAGEHFDIEWFDDERAPRKGRLFAEPAPEPPPAPFEIVHDRDLHPRSGKKQPAPMAAAPLPRADSKFVLPPFWIRAFWGFMPIILTLAGYASIIFTQGKVGYAWDEAYYFEPSEKAADWLTEALRGKRPFSREKIDEYWSERSEHPSIQKFLSGISLRTFSDPNRAVYAMRFPMAILFGITLALIYLIGRRAFGPMSGLIAAILYATLPRVFGHAHFATMETPLLFMMVLVVFCYLRGLDSPFWAVMTGVSFGLLLATKINGFFLPIPLIIWGHLYARRKYINNLFAMLTLGPLVMVAAWPWLWHDTAIRLLEYLRFHAAHQLTAVYFMGEQWGFNKPNAPWLYPSVMLLITTPVVALALMAVGVIRTVYRPQLRPYGAFFLICALVMLAVASAPATPKYDGVRLFLPVFPFLALLGGSGFVSLMRRIERLLGRYGAHDSRRREWFTHKVAFAFVLLLLIDGGGAIWRYYPFMLSYYNPLVGGLKGASRNYESIYWGEALNQDTVNFLNSLPPGTKIKPLAMHEKCFKDLQGWGVLDADLRFDADPPYDYHILQFRRGLFARPERALADTGAFDMVYEVTASPVRHILAKDAAHPIKHDKGDGVPLLAIYKTGPRFETYWPNM